MKKFKGTPGKWVSIENEYFMEIHPVDNRQVFAMTHTNEYIGIDKEVMRINAQLIASAPELLEALQKIAAWDDDLEHEYGNPGELANLAINKALGL